MREILFRAKRIDNGEWIQGYLWSGNDSSYIIPHSLGINYYEKEKRMMAFSSEVNIETVCQYTGLADREGRKIFEGDVIVIPHSDKKGFPAEVRYRELDSWFCIDRTNYVPISLNGVQYWGEVVGNVFDNPELIEWRRRRLGATEGKGTGKGRYLAMPLVEHVRKPPKYWMKTSCPICGRECWDGPLPEGITEMMFVGKLCTTCAMQMAAGRG